MKLKSIHMEEQMKHYNVPGLSIALLENGQIIGTQSYGLLEAESDRKVNENSIFSACSISKFLTGMIALKLVEERFLKLDEDINKRLVSWKVPENEFTKNRSVTLRNLLSHQSGIMDPEGSFLELNVELGIPSMVELLNGTTPYCKDPIRVQCEPESEFHYSDADFCIVQQLIEDVVGKPFHQVVNELIFNPLIMGNSYLNTKTIIEMDKKEFSYGHNKNGELIDEKYAIYPYPAASGLWTTSLDLARLLLELLNSLRGESKLGISERLAKEMITPQKGRSWTGLGVFLEGSKIDLEITSLGWGVGFQCMLEALLNIEKGAVIMTNAELGVHQMEGIIGQIYKSLMS